MLTRGGDTAKNGGRCRRPRILITTPESPICSSRPQQLLLWRETVILDEIHAVLDSKRGTHLIAPQLRPALPEACCGTGAKLADRPGYALPQERSCCLG